MGAMLIDVQNTIDFNKQRLLSASHETGPIEKLRYTEKTLKMGVEIQLQSFSLIG